MRYKSLTNLISITYTDSNTQWSIFKNFRQSDPFWKSFNISLRRYLIRKLIYIEDYSPSFKFFGSLSAIWQVLKVDYGWIFWFLRHITQTRFAQKLLNQLKNDFQFLKVHEKGYISCRYYVVIFFLIGVPPDFRWKFGKKSYYKFFRLPKTM